MLRKKISKIIALMMVVGVAASTAPIVRVQAAVDTAVEATQDYDESTFDNLNWAIQEMRTAYDEICAGSYDTERVMAFADAAKVRLENLDADKLAAIPGGQTHAEVTLAYYDIVKKMVDEKNELIKEQLGYAVEEIDIALGYLNEGFNDYEIIITFAGTAIERVRPMVISQNNPLYDDYKYVVEEYGYILSTCTEKYEYSYEQLHSAHTEIIIALNEINEAEKSTSTKTKEAYDRIMAFAITAVERVRPEMENKGTMYKYWSAQYEDVSRLYGEIVTRLNEWVFDGSENNN